MSDLLVKMSRHGFGEVFVDGKAVPNVVGLEFTTDAGGVNRVRITTEHLPDVVEIQAVTRP